MDSYIGEIRIFSGTFAPKGWAFCNGQLLAISQYTALFSILGVTYGGDGRTTFGLPNLQNRTVMHAGNGSGLTPRSLGEIGGDNQVTLSVDQLASHTHAPYFSNVATQKSPQNAIWASTSRPEPNAYTSNTDYVAMHPRAVSPTGGGGPHENRQPFVTMNYIISLQGVFPPHP